jgi:hypothetical protein
LGQTRQNSFQLNWGTTLNSPVVPGLPLSGTLIGTMASTNTIYSNVQIIPQYHNIGLEVTWTGTPTGTISVLGSISGNNFYALTFSPALTQPAGSAGGYLIDLNQVPFTYLAVQYTNSSGSGSLTVWFGQRDLG